MRILLLSLAAGTAVFGLACDKPSESTTTTAGSTSAATSASAVVITASSASAMASSSPPPSASPADPQDAKLGLFIKDAAQALVNAATGKPVDAKWSHKDPAQAVSKLTDPDDKKLLDALGRDLTIVAVEMELSELAQPGPDEHHELSARAIMLADGTVRWGTVAHRHEKAGQGDPTPGLEKSAPAVVEAGGRLMKALGATCTMPWLAPSDVAAVPMSIQHELVTDMTATKASCAEIAKVKGEWRAHIDDIRVLVSGGGHHGFLTSVFDVEPNTMRLTLSPLHVEVVPGAQGGVAKKP